ncbi:protein phosphatase CheZ [Desulfovibrio sp. OttesenSCG-928-A18]|nr:protein phosphatase CheZ [Desulfovibrio sp. OttesenSCG-928-A18]
MISQEEILDRVLARVSDKVAESVKETVMQAVQRELSSTMTKVMVEGEFYRQLNEQMRLGLRGIYKEIDSASKEEAGPGMPAGKSAPDTDSVHTQKLFSDAARQIEEIMQTTFNATEKIMETVERLLEQQEEAGTIIAALEGAGNGPAAAANEKALARLDGLNQELAASLTDIITELSFQDLTGQRLKKVVSAINSIRETVFDLYVSTGIMLKSREEEPEKDLTQIAEESKRKVEEIKKSELKGPSSSAASQDDVDDLLASLGL